MSRLKIFEDQNPGLAALDTTDHKEIQNQLNTIAVRFQKWPVEKNLEPGTSDEECMAAYADKIESMKAQEGFKAADVVSMDPSHPDKAALRRKFFQEHIHADNEVRFFVSGSALFGLHVNGRVYEITCVAGDLMSIPKGTTHWFDMGPEPNFVCFRFFDNPEGWVAQYTGSEIAKEFSEFVPA